jgi:hypothetical protein
MGQGFHIGQMVDVFSRALDYPLFNLNERRSIAEK